MTGTYFKSGWYKHPWSEPSTPEEVYRHDRHGYQSEGRDPETPQEEYQEHLELMNTSLRQWHRQNGKPFKKLSSCYYWLLLPRDYHFAIRRSCPTCNAPSLAAMHQAVRARDWSNRVHWSAAPRPPPIVSPGLRPRGRG